MFRDLWSSLDDYDRYGRGWGRMVLPSYELLERARAAEDEAEKAAMSSPAVRRARAAREVAEKAHDRKKGRLRVKIRAVQNKYRVYGLTPEVQRELAALVKEMEGQRPV